MSEFYANMLSLFWFIAMRNNRNVIVGWTRRINGTFPTQGNCSIIMHLDLISFSLSCLVLALIKRVSPSVNKMQAVLLTVLLWATCCGKRMHVSPVVDSWRSVAHPSFTWLDLTRPFRFAVPTPKVHFHLRSGFPISATQFIQSQAVVLLYEIM